MEVPTVGDVRPAGRLVNVGGAPRPVPWVANGGAACVHLPAELEREHTDGVWARFLKARRMRAYFAGDRRSKEASLFV